jgi:hypothetical protein
MKTIPLLLIAASCVVSSLTATAQTPVLLRTFNNPTPNTDDNFGSAMAALGNDRLVIGARYDDADGTGYTVLIDFTVLADNYETPSGPLVQSGSALYGLIAGNGGLRIVEIAPVEIAPVEVEPVMLPRNRPL